MTQLNHKYFFRTKISDRESADTGLAFVLVLLLLGYLLNNILFVGFAIPLLLIAMIFPKFYYYPAVIWLGFSKLLGSVTSKIILSIIFFLFIVPMGFIRRLLGKDTLLLKQFKKNSKSVLITRNYLYTEKDIEKPY